MGYIVCWVIFQMFIIWDCVFYDRHHEEFPTTGWKQFLIAITPGSGFYYKWRSEQKEIS